ncbi:MAG: hypothetical protein HYS13_13185 [Planctomycetia bacterium]|nr:hypothetical protein [Planctomycetia bacterium]
MPPDSVVPLDQEVIDIGMSKRSIRQRLDGFEQTALKPCRGKKSSAWKYRNEFVQDYDELINFAGLFVSWRTFPWSLNEGVFDYEQRLLREYRDKWGRRPAINQR